MLDIGCGPGGNVEYARFGGIDAFGIDGDQSTLPNKPYFQKVDYRYATSSFEGPFDLGWSIEFAEHIGESYIENFFNDFAKCKRIIFTAAPPGWGGVGHVNEQPESYWVEKFDKFGFVYDSELTKTIRKVSNLVFKGQIRMQKKQFVQNRGLVFRNTLLANKGCFGD